VESLLKQDGLNGNHQSLVVVVVTTVVAKLSQSLARTTVLPAKVCSVMLQLRVIFLC